jgi:complement component 1 Q subcomponent-binding protein, mitochondrial
MFSIADLQSDEDIQSSEEEDQEGGGEEGQEAGDDAPYHSYPVRTSLSITKVGFPPTLLFFMPSVTRLLHRRLARVA